MRFDDRLLTVLSQPAADRHDAAVRWRQLVDLVARAGLHSTGDAVAHALQEIRSEAPKVDEQLRAAAARAVAALPLPLGLLEYFASDRLSVATPVLAAATLDRGQWQALFGIADEETQRFIETLHPELKPEPPLDLTETLVEVPEEEPPSPPVAGPSLRDVVTRIERRRRGRQAPQASGNGAAVQPGSPALFRWECSPSGEIAWVEGAPRGALIGRSIARSSNGDSIDQTIVRAFTMRAPFRDAPLIVGGDGLVSGEWKISGVPAFDPADGRFAGYRGVALREESAHTPQPPDLLADPDSLRELVHEIKTPLNAIIGFAEIIEGQYLGPADRPYRERAADIVTQARMLLTAIDDLDFAAKIHAGGRSERPSVDLGELIETMAPSLREHARERGVDLDFTGAPRNLVAAVEPELADRLVFRLCSAIISRGEEGERLRLSAHRSADRCRVAISRPKAIEGVNDEKLFGDQEGAIGDGIGLRLARGLARIAGGDLVSTPGEIALLFARR